MNKMIICLLACLHVFGIAFSQDITGSWYGNPDIGGIKMRIVFHISQNGTEYMATMDSPDQKTEGIPIDSVIFEYPHLTLKITRLSFTFSGELKNDGIIEGAIVQHGAMFPVKLGREKIIKNRPQTPNPPFPYISEDVYFPAKNNDFKLAGTLTIPDNKDKYPAVVLITGSGQQNRNEEISEHKPFLVLADYLTRNGIAVLRYDDRGFGESGGNPINCTSADFAMDAQSAVDYLKIRKEIDKEKIGLIGHSEGGSIAFMLASENNGDIAYIVSMAGGAIRGDSILLDQRNAISKAMGYSDQFLQIDRNLMREAFKILYETTDKNVLKEKYTRLFGSMQTPESINIMVEQLSSPWMRYFLNHDPTVNLSKIKCPVLALNGEKDLQVLSEINLKNIEKSVTSNGNNNVKTIEYPGLNHLFQTCKTGLVQEYGEIEETINPQVLKDITEWILEVVK